MSNRTNDDLPEIDTRDFLLGLSKKEQRCFRSQLPAFVSLVHQIIKELNLQGHIKHINICSPDRCRAELYRNHENPWPSKNLCLDIYTDKYMDDRLLRHEFMHEADRRDPEMKYDPAIEERWKGEKYWILEMAANISVDARLGDSGLGKKRRQEEFNQNFGEEYNALFEEVWGAPPATWPDIVALATKLSKILRGNNQDRLSASGKSKCRLSSSKDE